VFGVPEDVVVSTAYDLSNTTKTVLGMFVDGNGKYEERSYPSNSDYKYLYTIRSLKVGDVGIVMEPVGYTDAAQRVVGKLSVIGTMPIPPPGPVPPPTPVAKHIRLSIVIDHENVSPEVAAVLNALVGWNSFFDSGNDYRKYDMTSTEPAAREAVKQLNATIPGIVVADKDTGAVIYTGSLPATFADLKNLVGRLTFTALFVVAVQLLQIRGSCQPCSRLLVLRRNGPMSRLTE
jgi:hypothetical protein